MKNETPSWLENAEELDQPAAHKAFSGALRVNEEPG
jgi:hypothetical protein